MKFTVVFGVGIVSVLFFWLIAMSSQSLETKAVDAKTLEKVKQAQVLGLEWFANNFYEKKLFHYWHNPQTDKLTTKNNALRQLMASRTVAEAANHDESLLAIHRDNLKFIFKYWYQEEEGEGYIYYSDKSKLGANAMLLRTLVYSPDYEEQSVKAAAVARGIVALQGEDGSFVPWYKEPGYGYDAAYLLYFYSGEATVALVEYAEKSGEAWALEAAVKAADFYQREYVDMIAENYHPAYVPWHTMAYERLYQLTGDKHNVESIFVMNDRLLELLDTEIHPGRFYKKELEHEGQKGPHTSSDAVYLEGLIYAYKTAVEVGDKERAERYWQAIDLGINRLLDLQYTQTDATFPADPKSYVGAVPISEINKRVRVDTTQHTMDAFGIYLEVFEDKK